MAISMHQVGVYMNKLWYVLSQKSTYNSRKPRYLAWWHRNSTWSYCTHISNQETEFKYVYTTELTDSVFHTPQSYSPQKFSLGVILGTPGCICAVLLDCNNVQVVTRIGLQSSIIVFIQEVGDVLDIICTFRNCMHSQS